MNLASSNVGQQVVRAYLSRQHFEDVENSRPMAAPPSDVSRNGKSAKRVSQTVLQAMVSVSERSSLGNRQPRGTTAQATPALCVVGVVVARALVDRALADELRDACMTVALNLGGWDRCRNSKRANPKGSRLSA